MPVASIKLGEFADIDAAEGFSDYDGPTPPRGSYRCVVKWWKLVTNSKGNPMFKVIFEIHEPKDSPKARFNGYAIWHNANITKTSAPFLNAMLDGLGLSRSGKIILSADKAERVVKIGGKVVDGIEVVIGTARVEYPLDSDNWKLEAKTFTPAAAPKSVSTSKDEDGDEADEADADDYEEADGPADAGGPEEDEDAF